MASAAACRIWAGVMKSGSPPPRSITSLPWALSWRAFSETARVGEGAAFFTRSARKSAGERCEAGTRASTAIGRIGQTCNDDFRDCAAGTQEHNGDFSIVEGDFGRIDRTVAISTPSCRVLICMLFFVPQRMVTPVDDDSLRVSFRSTGGG